MSKELVISANRHETRVAIVEDEQVVEVYHQREHEYSLAGSIHKGRVTRVLPGMQSAFVDIGLERDAFLYVSDFFEDNEEYDKVVTSVEDKVLTLDRAGQSAPLAPAAVVSEVASSPVPEAVPSREREILPSRDRESALSREGAVASPEPAPVESPSSPSVTPPPGPSPATAADQRRDDHDRRGRRGRRRRGGKGRGLPDSKFYSPGATRTLEQATAPQSAQKTTPEPTTEQAPPAPVADDFFVLPGESLAKYSRSEAPGSDAAAEEFDLDSLPEVSEEISDEAQPEVEAHSAAADEFKEAEPLAGSEPRPSGSGRATPPPQVEQALEPEHEEEAPLPESDSAADLDDEDSRPVSLPELLEAVTEAAATGTPEPEPPTPGAEVMEAESDALAAEELIAAEEGPEPARIPTSLTATLREQGPRYLHRVSRRMRRKGRGGQADFAHPPHAPAAEERPVSSPAPARPPQEQRQTTVNGKPERGPATSISDLLKEGQEIIVQIAKEPLGQKGARITSHIALPGRFLVYMPTVDHVGVSRKIPSDDERIRLKRILQNNRSGIPGGFIVRTAGEGHTEQELRADMMFLYNLWLDLRQKAERKPAPALIHHDLNVVERVLRDQLTASFKSIWVDNEELYESVLSFVQRFQPALVSRVKMYTRSNPIFDEFGITAELEKALRPKVWLKSGGYIVINQTEALVAIDINTGKFVGKSNRLEDTIVKTNTDAIKEIVRQIRLRDLGGIIVVDFIDMDERKNRQKVMQALEEAMRADRAPYKILQFNDFGLVAITRKRVKQSLERTLCTPCPYCEGAGYVKSPQTVVGEILQEAQKVAKVVEGKDVMLRVGPDVARLLKSHQNSYLQELEEILGRTVIVKSDNQLHQEKFDLG
jgi:Rne/Rng family ribonuclease